MRYSLWDWQTIFSKVDYLFVTRLLVERELTLYLNVKRGYVLCVTVVCVCVDNENHFIDIDIHVEAIHYRYC